MEYKAGDLARLLSGESEPLTSQEGDGSKITYDSNSINSPSSTASVADSDLEEYTSKFPAKRKFEPTTEKERQEERQKKKKEEQKRTVFVGNFPLKKIKKVSTILKSLALKVLSFNESKAEEESISAVYSRSIPIKSVKCLSGSSYKEVIKNTIKSKNFDTSNPKNYCNAYIVFKTKELSEKFLKKVNSLSGENAPSIYIEEFKLRFDSANKSKEEREFDRKRTIFVGNLPFKISEQEVFEFFNNKLKKNISKKEKERDFVKAVRIIRDKKTNLGKGFCYVLLGERRFVRVALKFNGTNLKKRKLRVSKIEKK
eukprot:snap_masked-scaffold_9-processed-gene-6.19-mRNA-1 protein AED:1.00 eAED:1.00 QI:0/-1/0/0/-1/1/1/0/312